jgi:hypothetical protein
VIERVGRWNVDALVNSYLAFYRVEGLLGLGDWDPHDRRSFWAERFCIEVRVLHQQLRACQG